MLLKQQKVALHEMAFQVLSSGHGLPAELGMHKLEAGDFIEAANTGRQQAAGQAQQQAGTHGSTSGHGVRMGLEHSLRSPGDLKL